MTNDYWLEAKNISCFKNECEVVKDLNLKLKYSENVILLGEAGLARPKDALLFVENLEYTRKKDGRGAQITCSCMFF